MQKLWPAAVEVPVPDGVAEVIAEAEVKYPQD